MHLNTTLKCSLIALLFVTVVQALTDELEDEGPWDSRIRLMKKGFGGPDSRIRLTKKYMPDAARITPMKKDRRIRLMKKSGLASNMAVPYFDPTPSQRASNEEEMPESLQNSDEYDSKMDQEINRIVNLIMNKYSSRQSEMIKRGGYIRLV